MRFLLLDISYLSFTAIIHVLHDGLEQASITDKDFVLRWLGEQHGFGYPLSIDGEASFNVSMTTEVSQFQLLWASVFFHPQIYL